ncbi:MAG: DUF4358 domain-containing protein [Clostridium sp.]|nr:DUF4358 domain-containing protein [Clostridium sp.]
MKKDTKYCKTKERKAFKISEGFSMASIRKIAFLLAVSLVLAGCGGADKSAGDAANPAENTDSQGNTESTESNGSQGNADVGENADAQENADAGESAGSQENTGAAEAADDTNDANSNAADAKAASPQDIYKLVEKSVELPSMVEGDDDFISNYYGIDPANLDSYVFACAEYSTLATSVIIMKAKDEAVVETLVSSLNTVIEQKAAEMEGYIPEQYDIVADSSVKTEGLYVYLVIAENAGDIEAIISAALK